MRCNFCSNTAYYDEEYAYGQYIRHCGSASCSSRASSSISNHMEEAIEFKKEMDIERELERERKEIIQRELDYKKYLELKNKLGL